MWVLRVWRPGRTPCCRSQRRVPCRPPGALCSWVGAWSAPVPLPTHPPCPVPLPTHPPSPGPPPHPHPRRCHFTLGNSVADAYKSLELARTAWGIATGGELAGEQADPNLPWGAPGRGVLRPGGSLVMKLLQGTGGLGAAQRMHARMRRALCRVWRGLCKARRGAPGVHAAAVGGAERPSRCACAHRCAVPLPFPLVRGRHSKFCGPPPPPALQAPRSLLPSCDGTLPRWPGTAPRPPAARAR